MLMSTNQEGVEGIMKKMSKLVAAVMIVAALSAGQSALMAAPMQGAGRALTHSRSDGLYARFLRLLTAVWGGGGTAVWGGGTAVWGGGTAVWGGGN
jgi:hypothetical protein